MRKKPSMVSAGISAAGTVFTFPAPPDVIIGPHTSGITFR